MIQWETLCGALLVLQVLVTPLHSTSTVEQVVIPASALEGTHATVHQHTSNQNLSGATVTLLGNSLFAINSSSYFVYNTGAVPPGRYALTIVTYLEGASSQSFDYLTVDVTPNANQACEMQLFGKCSQFCTVNAVSTYGYSCSCADGYILQQDNLTCLAFEPLPFLLVATDNGLTQVDLLTRQQSPVSVTGVVDHFDYHHASQTLFYADNARQVISSVNMDGNGGEEVFWSYGPDMVSAVIVDWVNGSVVYATDASIVAVNMETGEASTVHSGLNQPRSLVIHANSEQQRLLFWVEGEDGVFVIRKSSLTDNSPPSNIITSTLRRPADLSVDSVTKTLYWMTEIGDVCSSDYNGDSTVCFQCCNGQVLAGIAVFEVFVYLSLRESNSVVQIQRDLANPSPVVYEGITNPSELVVAHPLKQPGSQQVISSCDECDQLCVVTANTLRCDCHPGYRLSPNRHSCYIDETSDLILAQSFPSSIGGSVNSVVRTSLSGREKERLVDNSFGARRSPKTGLVYGMDYDRQSNGLFYSDRDSSTLWRVSLNRRHSAQDDRVLLGTGVRAWDLTLDWTDNTVYWSDDINGTIGAVSTNGKSATLILTDLAVPRGLAVDPLNRQLYWAEADNGSIWRYDLSTLQSEVFVLNLSSPSGLVIDHQASVLYWAELSGRIGRIALDGSGEETVYNDPSSSPFKLSVYRDYLLWIDAGGADSVNVLRVSRPGESGRVSIVPLGDRTLTALLVVGSNRQLTRGQYECVQNTTGCSHFCGTDVMDATVCSCPPGYTLTSETTCVFEGECPACSGDCLVEGSELTCSCPPGFRGLACDQECEEGTYGERCAEICTCLNGGACDPVDGSCICTAGYEGTNCAQPICSEDCQNGGTCAEPDLCSCLPSFGGPTCVQRVCTSDFCLNGGTCTEDFGRELSCRCPSDTSGLQCQFLDIILFPQSAMISVSVSVPLGLLLLSLLAIAVVGGVYYYIRCLPHRKTNPLESQDDIPPPKNISSPEPETSAGAEDDGDTASTRIELEPPRDSEHHNTVVH